jgi:hypothetical protein
VIYECGGTRGLPVARAQRQASSKASQAFWQVADVEKEVRGAEARGVTFEEYGPAGDFTMKNTHRTGGGAKDGVVQRTRRGTSSP